MNNHITDPDDYCGHCRGSGQVKEITDRNTILHDRCDFCGGSGLRSIIVKQTQEHAPSSAYGGGGPVQKTTHGTVVPFKSPRDAWIADNLPAHDPETWRDQMRSIERLSCMNLHDPWLRDLRAADYLNDKADKISVRAFAVLSFLTIGATFAVFTLIFTP